MPPTALPVTYCAESDLQAMIGLDAEVSHLDDDQSGAVDGPEATYLSQAISWATEQCNKYLLGRYRETDLATSWLVNQWCTIAAAYWLSVRRGNPSPAAVAKLYAEAVKDMTQVHDKQFDIPHLGTRNTTWPAWSNVRVDALYQLRKVRVERPISDRRPSAAQNRDIAADLTIEPN